MADGEGGEGKTGGDEREGSSPLVVWTLTWLMSFSPRVAVNFAGGVSIRASMPLHQTAGVKLLLPTPHPSSRDLALSVNFIVSCDC